MSDAYCPSRGGLMFKVRDNGDLEIACGNCRDADRKAGKNTWLVLHVFSPEGDLIDTERLAPIQNRRR